MIRKLKRKFTVLATVSMFLLMAALVLIMNIVNYSSVVSESDATLDVLAGGFFAFADMTPPEIPDGAEAGREGAASGLQEGTDGADALFLPDGGEAPEGFEGFFSRFEGFPRGMSPEVPYEARYFTVMVMEDGTIIDPDFSRIITVDLESSHEYVEQAVSSGSDRGFTGRFRYLKTAQDGVTRIMFLDCGRKLDVFTGFLRTSVLTGLAGCMVVFLVFLLAAGRIIKPIAESYEKQKRFISDAGHEIKTPLTIINANVDLLECDGENEELSEIRAQSKRLTALTNDLVLLSRMEETEQKITAVDFPLSDIVAETANPFRAPAAAKRVVLTASIAPGVTLHGSPEDIRRLVSILMDNAVKYVPEGGTISLSLVPVRKNAVLTVENTTADPIDRQEMQYVFDRFYRTDASRNTATGGHGIGLSIAKAITDTHGGSIAASTGDGMSFRVTVTLPVTAHI